MVDSDSVQHRDFCQAVSLETICEFGVAQNGHAEQQELLPAERLGEDVGQHQAGLLIDHIDGLKLDFLLDPVGPNRDVFELATLPNLELHVDTP